ncbi:MAG: L-arabinose isomerase [Candidatus Marinimicrobia bacterium]|nr:L-arabinose isomerase [Candidatus Neomarinimicrobiota bacterium]
MINLDQYEVWFVTGSQHLYGDEALKQVDEDSKIIAEALDKSDDIPVNVVFKPVLTTPEAIKNLIVDANNEENCVGLITWMHTFSPAQMWIPGLKILDKPLVHLHTQFNEKIPYESIDMDFMNLNQSAHGGREYGFMLSRMRMDRKVVVGHYKNDKVQKQLGTWTRSACAWADWQGMKVARFGDNMRNVAVTEGDKVEANIQFGYSVPGYGVGDLVAKVDAVAESDIKALLADYEKEYNINTEAQDSIKEAARIELGMRAFLEEGGFKAFTTNFENLYGLKQLPGIAVQRLMADGYGFGAEGDWKTAALVRAMKVMSSGLEGGTSFMEFYTYNLEEDNMNVLGAHMLELCPSIASEKPELDVYPLGIGGKNDPARLIFNTNTGPGVNATIMDMGNRFRMLINPCDVIEPKADLPNLPVARVLWEPKPSLEVESAAWILAGGTHHTGFSMAVNTEHLEDFATMAGIEALIIDDDTNIRDFKKELKWNELYYAYKQGM